MILGLIVTNNRGLTPIFAIPVALAAWMFQPRQAVMALGSVFLMLIIMNTIAVKSLLWPVPLTITFLCGLVSALIVVCAICVLRYALDVTEIARQRAWQAEQQMTRAYKQEQHLNELKDQFLLNINHELRTPLTSLHGYLQLLQLHQGNDGSNQSPLLAHIVQSSEELVHMVNTLLDALQYSNTAIQPQSEDLSVVSIVQSAANLFEPQQWQSHHLDLLIPEPLTVRADRQLFHQVLWNLLSNACKYSPAQTTVTVGAQQETGASQQDSVCIWVQDAGPGIASNEIPLLFGKFSRLKRDQAGTVRGAGLGLYICKQLVEAMGGRIWVESSGVVGEGSRFYFTLPSASQIS
ncbi:MAG: HAMP domain-containing histidine kinase [Chloroflexi bacterium]|nr:HAMP domain-containing histidine kinase [Chloroflexota bacterium]